MQGQDVKTWAPGRHRAEKPVESGGGRVQVSWKGR